jgi:hypothetical protein
MAEGVGTVMGTLWLGLDLVRAVLEVIGVRAWVLGSIQAREICTESEAPRRLGSVDRLKLWVDPWFPLMKSTLELKGRAVVSATQSETPTGMSLS